MRDGRPEYTFVGGPADGVDAWPLLQGFTIDDNTLVPTGVVGVVAQIDLTLNDKTVHRYRRIESHVSRPELDDVVEWMAYVGEVT